MKSSTVVYDLSFSITSMQEESYDTKMKRIGSSRSTATRMNAQR
jgi:hypothetical protein